MGASTGKRRKDGWLVCQVAFSPSDTALLEAYQQEQGYSSPQVAIYSLVMAGLKEFPSWGISVVDRNRALFEFRRGIMQKVFGAFMTIQQDLADEIALTEAAQVEAKRTMGGGE